MKNLVQQTEDTVKEIGSEAIKSFSFTANKDYPAVGLKFLTKIAALKRKEFIEKVFFQIFEEKDLVNKTAKAAFQPGKSLRKSMDLLDQDKVKFIIGMFTF
jgi:hypothetical protein